MNESAPSFAQQPADPVRPGYRAGIVAVIGRANVGKSTLINAILDEKVSIVSPVAQTTRNLVRGVYHETRGQIVFLDTPGMHKAVADLGRMMNRIARAAMEGADAALLLLDGSSPPREEDAGWMTKLRSTEIPLLVAVNKCDQSRTFTDQYRSLWDQSAPPSGPTQSPDPWLAVSGQQRRGVAELIDRLFALLPESPPLFPDELLSDFPRKLFIADIVREKYFLRLQDDLPHAIAIEIESIREDGPAWTVEGNVLVDKPSQKGIVLGRKGRLLKAVREESEDELAALFERPVALRLWVRVARHWARDPVLLKRLGYAS